MFRYGLLTMAKRGQETTHERNNTTPAGVPPCRINESRIKNVLGGVFADDIFLWLCLQTLCKQLFYCFGVDASANKGGLRVADMLIA
jgi:hypothetical protein